MKSTGFVSGNPGASAMVNGLDQPRFERFQRAPLMSTSSAVRSPDPWNQHTSRSLVGSSTIDEEWLCQDSSGKMSSPEYRGSAAGAIVNATIAARTANP